MSNTSAISSTPTYYSLDSASTSVGASRTPVKTLDQNDFLKLLATQYSNQDPLSPKQDTDFISQMAQFTALEQSKTMASDMEQMHSDQQQAQARALLGNNVLLQLADGATTSGTVTGVNMDNGVPTVVVNGANYNATQVLAVSPGPNPLASDLNTLSTQLPGATQNLSQEVAQLRAQQDLSQAYGMLGRGVTVRDAQGNPVSGVVTGVTVAAGTPQIVVNGGLYSVSQITSVTSGN